MTNHIRFFLLLFLFLFFSFLLSNTLCSVVSVVSVIFVPAPTWLWEMSGKKHAQMFRKENATQWPVLSRSMKSSQHVYCKDCKSDFQLPMAGKTIVCGILKERIVGNTDFRASMNLNTLELITQACMGHVF